MRKFYLFILISLILVLTQYSFGQKGIGFKEALTADSLASANNKDALTNFFKIALDNITGTNKGISLTSSLFAIMLKQNPKLNIDTNYVKYTSARNTNIDINVNLNNKNQFNGFTLGVKYAIINKRDYTIAKEFIPLVLKGNQMYYTLHKKIMEKIQQLPNQELKEKYNTDISKIFNYRDSSFTFNKLDADEQKFILQIAKENNLNSIQQILQQNPNTSFYKLAKDNFNEIRNTYQNKPLWTIALNAKSFNDQFQISGINLSTEFLKGVINPKSSSNLEIIIQGNYDLSADSTSLNRELKRQVLSGNAGVNWVMKGWGNNLPFIEFSLTAADNYIISDLFNNETRQLFTLNGTLRFRISNDIWIPITIKYDPKSGNVFGFLNLTVNFTALGLKK